MNDLVEELHKHSNYLYGENVSDCRRLMRQAAVEIKRLRAAQVGAGDGGRWQPISTAPKDGTRLWLFYPARNSDDQQKVGWWEVEAPEGEPRWMDCDDAMLIEPTHWMPSPQAPAAVRAAVGAGDGAENERVRHVKRGTEYEVLHECAEIQASPDSPLTDYEVCVVYRSLTDGRVWVRRRAEFRDGRFVTVGTDVRAGKDPLGDEY